MGRRRLGGLAAALLAVGLAVAACGGSGGHSRRIEAAAWKPLGPQGGVVIGLVAEPNGSRTVYAATYDSVFKSVDGGSRWTVSATGLGEGVVLVVAPSSPRTLYAGDGRVRAAQVMVAAPSLVSRSVDGGATWTPADSGLPAGAAIATLAVDPSDADTVYAGLTTPGVLTSGPYAGIFKTSDGGKSWREVNSGLPETYDGYPKIDALAIDPRSPRTVYAATRTGVYESTDGGGSWVVANRGLGTGLSAAMVSGLVVDPATPGVVYAATDKGLFKRADAGGRWTRTALSARAVALAADPAGTLYAATERGVFRSDDAGTSWAKTGRRTAIGALAIDRRRPATLYAATIDGAVRSADGGAHWQTASSGLTARIGQVVALDTRSSQTMYLGTAFSGIFESTDAGRTWEAANTGLGRVFGHRPTVFALTQDPARNRLYASTENGLFVREKGGATWRRLTVDDDPVYGVRTVAIDPKQPRNLYAASESGLAASTDGGATWHAIEQGLGSNDKYDVLALAIDPRNSRTLYLGTSEGSVYRSEDRGVDWRPARSGLPCEGDTCSSVWQLVVDPSSSNTLYAVTRKGVFKSTDGASSWRSAGKGLPTARAGRVATASLLIDPKLPSTLYAATAAGVFRSEDAADSWTPIGRQPTHKGVVALALDPAARTLYAATAGGVYVAGARPPRSAER